MTQAKDEEIAAKKLEEDEDSYDFNEYEPTDEEILNRNYEKCLDNKNCITE